MEPKYKIGDKAWIADAGMKQVQKECPVCYGKKEVTLILGNGESLLLPCEGCSVGYEPPRGYNMEYEYTALAAQDTIKEIRCEYHEGRADIHYIFISNRYEEEINVFDNQEDATKLSAVRMKEYEAEEIKRSYNVRGYQAKNYSRKAGYHLREAKRLAEEIEYHNRMAKYCKDRAKT
jgi:hypothetical protein